MKKNSIDKKESIGGNKKNTKNETIDISYSNSIMSELISEDLKNKYYSNKDISLTSKIREHDANEESKMDTYKEKYQDSQASVEKVFGMELDTGKVEVGLNSEKKIVIGISKKTAINQNANSEDEKTIAKNRSMFKYLNKDILYYDGKNEEAIAIELNISKKAKKPLKDITKIVEDKDRKFNTLNTTLPFLNKEESIEKIEILKELKKSSKENSSGIDKEITKENNRIVKKDAKRIDFTKKLNKGIAKAKDKKQKLLDDLIIRRKKLEEEILENIKDNENKTLVETENKAGE